MSIFVFCRLDIIVIFPFSFIASVMRSVSISSFGILLSASKNLYVSSSFISFFSFHPIFISFCSICSFSSSFGISVIHIVFSCVFWFLISIGGLRKLFSLLFLFLYLG